MKHCVLNWQVRKTTHTFTGILLKRFNTVVFVSDSDIPIIDVVGIQQGFDESTKEKHLQHKVLAKKTKDGYADVKIIVSKSAKMIERTEQFLDENDGLLGDVPDNLNGTFKADNYCRNNIFRLPRRAYDRYTQEEISGGGK